LSSVLQFSGITSQLSITRELLERPAMTARHPSGSTLVALDLPAHESLPLAARMRCPPFAWKGLIVIVMSGQESDYVKQIGAQAALWRIGAVLLSFPLLISELLKAVKQSSPLCEPWNTRYIHSSCLPVWHKIVELEPSFHDLKNRAFQLVEELTTLSEHGQPVAAMHLLAIATLARQMQDDVWSIWNALTSNARAGGYADVRSE